MPQGHTFWPSRTAAGMQDQGNVVRRGLGCRNSGGGIREVNVALCAHFHRDYWDLAVRGCTARELRADRRTKQNLGIGVSEEEEKLLVGVRRVQRGGCPCDGSG